MNEQKICISVVIPLYNGSDHIHKCIEELDKQDCSFPYEVFIVDDASTDDSADIVEKQIKGLNNSEKFTLIRSPHNGRAGTARNIGVKVAHGTYILFIDQDDYPDTKLLRVLWDNSMNGKVDLVSCAIMDRNGKPFYRPVLSAAKSLTDEERKNIIRSYGYVFASLIRRALLIDNGIQFAENVMFEDCLYNSGVMACVGTIQTIEDVLYFRYNEQGSQTGSFSKRKLDDRIQATLIYLKTYENNRQICKYIHDIRIVAFYYIYLSCMFWLITIPKLYTKEQFNIILKEGKKLNIPWSDIKEANKSYNRFILSILHTIYVCPIMAYPIRLSGTTTYKLLKLIKK